MRALGAVVLVAMSRRSSYRRLRPSRGYGDIIYVSLIAIIVSSTLMRDAGGTLKPYEMRELHAMWDDLIGNDAEAAELRRDEPRMPWTAPSLDQAQLAEAAPVSDPVTSEVASSLLGEPLPQGDQPVRVQEVAALDLKTPLDCQNSKGVCQVAFDGLAPKEAGTAAPL
jgi:hypothetical protein